MSIITRNRNINKFIKKATNHHQIRSISSFLYSILITLTSYAMLGDHEKTLNEGCSEYIEKSINPESFTNQSKKYLIIKPEVNNL